MEISDYILLSRNKTLYRASISTLSSLVCFNSQMFSLSSEIISADQNIDDSKQVFPDIHYSKTVMKSTFCTSADVNNLTANATYVTKTLANKKTEELLDKESVDGWYTSQVNACAELLNGEYESIRNIMTQTKAGEGHTMEEYIDPIKDINFLIDNSAATNIEDYATIEKDKKKK